MEYTGAHLKQLLDMIPYSASIKDMNERYRYVNKPFKELINDVNGTCYNEIIGKTVHEVWKEKNPNRIKRDTIISRGREIYIEEYNVRDNKMVIETQMFPIRDKEGNITGNAELLEECGRSKIFSKIVADRHEEISQLYDVLNRNRELEYGQMGLEVIIDELFRTLKCDYLSIYRSDQEDRSLVRQCLKGLDKYSTKGNTHVILRKGAINKVLTEKKVNDLLHISEIDMQQQQRELMREAQIKYIGTYPIQLQGQLWGIINIGYKGGSDRPYLKKSYMNNLCQKIVWIIKNHFLVEEILKEFSLGKKVDKELDRFFNSAVDFLCILDEDAKIKRVSDAWTEELGYTHEAIKGRSIYEFICEEDKEEVRDTIEKGIRDKTLIKNISRYYMQDGSIRWIAWNVECFAINGRELILGVGKDINNEKIAQEKRIRLRRDLEREKHKNLFFSTLSHEFKTPLNIILSITQLLEQSLVEGQIEDEDNRLNRYIDIINRNAYKTLKVANNLIDLIKMDTRMENLIYKYYNIVEVVEEITMVVAKYIEDKQISIIFDTQIEELAVWCHEESIERIMFNLLSNAIKYTPPKSQILVHLKVYPYCVGISVEDQGIGIGDVGDESIDTGKLIWNNKTVGLGLKIVDQLVSLHKGKLILQNIKPTGTKAIFTLPISEEDKDEEYTYRVDLSDRHRENCKKELCDLRPCN